jgi:para-nitrobenzyl esterase
MGFLPRAIPESGGGLKPPRMTLKQAEELEKTYLKDLGADTIAVARAFSAEDIQKNTIGMGNFWPAPDGASINENQYESYVTGSFNDTPILVGTNSNEGACIGKRYKKIPSISKVRWLA